MRDDVVAIETSFSIYALDSTDRVVELQYLVEGQATSADGEIVQGYFNGPGPGEILANDVSVDATQGGGTQRR